MRGPIQLCAVSLLLALLQQGFPRSPVISQRLYPVAVKKAVGEYERIAEAKINFDKAKVYSSVFGGVAIPFQDPSSRVTDPSASLGCGPGPTSNWNEIGQKYMLR